MNLHNLYTKPLFKAGGRKLKRISDVNAMGYNPYNQSPQSSFSHGPEAASPPINPYIGNTGI